MVNRGKTISLAFEPFVSGNEDRTQHTPSHHQDTGKHCCFCNWTKRNWPACTYWTMANIAGSCLLYVETGSENLNQSISWQFFLCKTTRRKDHATVSHSLGSSVPSVSFFFHFLTFNLHNFCCMFHFFSVLKTDPKQRNGRTAEDHFLLHFFHLLCDETEESWMGTLYEETSIKQTIHIWTFPQDSWNLHNVNLISAPDTPLPLLHSQMFNAYLVSIPQKNSLSALLRLTVKNPLDMLHIRKHTSKDSACLCSFMLQSQKKKKKLSQEQWYCLHLAQLLPPTNVCWPKTPPWVFKDSHHRDTRNKRAVTAF